MSTSPLPSRGRLATSGPRGVGRAPVARARRPTLVETVRDALVADLGAGRLGLGDKLPNEDELSARFGVSRATTREAVRGLVEAGCLSRVHGSGTYVTGLPRRQHSLDTTLSYTEMIEASGARAGLALMQAVERDATVEEAAALRLDAEMQVLAVERVRTADGRPVIYSRDRIPRSILPPGFDPDAVEPSLYKVLAGLGHPIARAEARLLPVIADARLARILSVAPGSALLHIEEVDFDELGTAVMVSSEWHVPDAFELRINRRAR